MSVTAARIGVDRILDSVRPVPSALTTRKFCEADPVHEHVYQTFGVEPSRLSNVRMRMRGWEERASAA